MSLIRLKFRIKSERKRISFPIKQSLVFKADIRGNVTPEDDSFRSAECLIFNIFKFKTQ